MSTNEDTILSQYNPGFRANLNMAPQQTDTRLLSRVDGDLNYAVPGTMFNADDVQPSDPEDIDSRVPDTPDKFMAQTRRVGFFKGFHDSAWIDNIDKAAELVDPTNKYMATLMAGRWRKVDNTILAGAFAPAYQYNGPVTDGAPASVNFPAAQIIAASDVSMKHDAEVVPANGSDYGMSVGKIIHAGLLLDDSELEGERYFAWGPQQKGDLLRRTPATSRYYNEVVALTSGTISNFMGFEFVLLPRSRFSFVLGHDGANANRQCMAWIKPALVYSARPIVDARIRIRSDKSDTPQAYYKGQHGVCRRYDKGVVQVVAYEGAEY